MFPRPFRWPLGWFALALAGFAATQPGNSAAEPDKAPVRGRHDKHLQYLHLSKDGKLLLGEFWDLNNARGSRLWLAGTGQSPPQFVGKVLGHSTALSIDGKHLVDIDSKGAVRLWDVASGKILHTLGGETTPVKKDNSWKATWATFSRDGKTIVLLAPIVGKEAKEVLRRFELLPAAPKERLGLKELRHFELARGVNEAHIFLSADAKTLARDDVLVNLDTGKRICKLDLPEGDHPLDLGFTPDGKTLIGYSFETPIYLWDAATGKRKRTIGGEKLTFRVRTNALSPDGRWIAANDRNDYSISIYELSTGKRLWNGNNNGGLLNYSLFSPDNKLIATASDNASNICVSEVATGQKLCTFAVAEDHGYFDNQMAFSPDGKLLFFASSMQIKVGDIATGVARTVGDTKMVLVPPRGSAPLVRESRLSFPEEDSILDLQFSPDGSYLAASFDKGLIGVWDLKTNALVHRIHCSCAVWTIRFDAMGTHIFGGCNDGKIRIWDARKGEPTGIFEGTDKPRRGILSLSLAPDGQSLVSCGRFPTVWNLSSKKEQVLKWEVAERIRDEAKMVLFSPTGDSFVSSLYHARILFWDPQTGEKFGEIHKDAWSASALAFSPGGEVLCTGDLQGNVTVWSTRDRAEMYKTKASRGTVHSVSFSSDGGLLLVGSDNGPEERGELLIWDFSTGQFLSGSWMERELKCLAVSPDGKLVASAGKPREISLYGLSKILKRE